MGSVAAPSSLDSPEFRGGWQASLIAREALADTACAFVAELARVQRGLAGGFDCVGSLGGYGMWNDGQMGLLVVGHGTRVEGARLEFWKVVRLVAARLPEVVVRGCFLEMAEPSIETALSELGRDAVADVVVAPLLLSLAGHAKRDVPAAISRTIQDLPGLRVRQAPPLGCHPEIIGLSAERFRQAAGRIEAAPRDSLLVLVSRGGTDLRAADDFRAFVARRAAHEPVGGVQAAFLSSAEPLLAEALARAACSPLKWVVVQPHLLFPGELMAKLRRMVTKQEDGNSRQRWIVADCLGCDRRVAAAVSDRFSETIGLSRG